jgi:hypothetical protein
MTRLEDASVDRGRLFFAVFLGGGDASVMKIVSFAAEAAPTGDNISPSALLPLTLAAIELL